MNEIFKGEEKAVNNSQEYIFNLQKRVENIENGYDCPLIFLSEIKVLSDTLEILKNKVLDIAVSELKEAKGEDKSYKKNGFEFSITASGRYSYNHFDEYQKGKDKLKNIEEKMKIAYKTKSDYIDSETGEVFPMAEYKPNKQSISIKKSK